MRSSRAEKERCLLTISVVLAASHVAILSQPAAVAKVIEEAADAIRK